MYSRLSAIKQRGYVVSLRRGNTGIGYTLETLLGLDENNLRTPDLGDIELKSQRNGVSNRVTMFTFNRGVFQDKLTRNRAGLEAYLGERKDVEIFVSSKNTADSELPETQPPNGFDLILTSPPYGDSQTTVAYGQFSRLSADWIGLEDSRKVDRISMGGSPKKRGLSDSPVDPAIAEIRVVDKKRGSQVEAFYIDLERSIGSVAPLLAKGSTICYVVGNRRVKGVTLPTDAFIISAFSKHGFSHKETIVRNIPNKRMPKKNSPSNVAGETDVTMHEENIVVCQRETKYGGSYN